MSTKSTIWYGEDWHLYHEAFDNQNVYLEFPGGGALQGAAIQIPLHIWKAFREAEVDGLEFVGISEDELRAKAEAAVDEHRAYLATATGQLSRLFGSLTFGPPESTRDEMVARYMDECRYEAEDEEADLQSPGAIEEKKR